MAKKQRHKIEHKKNPEALGISGFTLGIVGIMLLGWFGLIVGIVGIFFCIFQQKKKKTKFGKIGIIINGLVIVLSVFYIIILAPLLEQYLLTYMG